MAKAKKKSASGGKTSVRFGSINLKKVSDTLNEI